MKLIINTLLLLLLPVWLFAQLTPVTNQYVLNPLTINPAFAGNRGVLNVAAFYRKQWVGITGAPKTMTLLFDAPVNNDKIGLGLIITNDKIGVTKETSVNTNYAYKINMGDGILSLGLGAGIVATNTAWSDLTVLDPGDDYYLINSRVFVVPDFRFGAYYTARDFFAAVSIPKLLGYRFDFDKNKYSLKVDPGQYYYLINSGYLIEIYPNLKFFPSTLITFSPGEKVLLDLNAHFNIADRLWLGATYRNKRAIAALVQFAINPQLRFAYTYDFDFGQLGRFSNGSHEIMLRYEFRYKIDVVNPLIF